MTTKRTVKNITINVPSLNKINIKFSKVIIRYELSNKP